MTEDQRTATAIVRTVALVSRLSVMADALTGAIASALVGRRRLAQLRAERRLAEPPSGAPSPVG